MDVKRKYYRLTYLIIACLFIYSDLQSQKYAFFKYDVEDGLIQSQANSFCQDSNHYLWIATNGGLSRFDGIKFTGFSKSDGLLSNYTTNLFADKKNNIWVGTQFGLSCFNGKTFTNYLFKNNVIRYTTQDTSGNIWVIAGVDLYKITNNKAEQVTIIKDTVNIFSCFEVDDKKRLWVSVYRLGIFCLENNIWVKKINPLPQHENDFYTSIIFKHQHTGSLWLVYNKGILLVSKSEIQKEIKSSAAQEEFKTAKEDAFSNLWIAGTKGLSEYTNNNLIQFSAANGFTDNPVNNLFLDDENNMWLATEGAGIYRFSFSSIHFFDASTGLKNPLIMGIAKDASKTIFLGSAGGGLYRYDHNKLSNIRLPLPDQKTQTVVCIYNDEKNGLWTGTDNGGLWLYKKNTFTRIDNATNKLPPGYNSIYKDDDGTFWFATAYGLFSYNSGKATKLLSAFTTGIIAIGKDSLIAATSQGMLLITPSHQPQKITTPVSDLSSVVCFTRQKNYLFIGTENDGIIVWDFIKNTFSVINTKNNLSNDFVYSLLADGDNIIWVGTGRGINKIVFYTPQKFTVTNLTENGLIVSGECNQNSILKDDEGNIWFGFTKGVAIYNPHSIHENNLPPHVVLQSVSLFSKPIQKGKYTDSVSNFDNIPQHLKLPFNQNHLTFEFRGINFKNATLIQYQYKLEGVDKNFSDLTLKPFVVYPSLPPGKYSFIVRAFEPGAGYSDNTVALGFEITAPFYKTTLFNILLIVLLIGISILAQAYYTRRKAIRAKQLSDLKTHEQHKIRQKTSEDFHDELGNKLTRISVLADILETKAGNKSDVKKIVIQIKENVSALYKGTKDILWSLNPESDKLDEVIKHLCEFGAELFYDSDINFRFERSGQIEENIKMPGDFNRNILMIFKEAMTNILKHAECKNVNLSIAALNDNCIIVLLKDDGKGFNINHIKKGYGLNNLRVRAERIDANLQIESCEQEGTLIKLAIKIPLFA